MNDNTRVLACRIDEDLRLKMKEHIARKGVTVKEYVTTLIKEDLEKEENKTKGIIDFKESKNQNKSKSATKKKNEEKEAEEFE